MWAIGTGEVATLDQIAAAHTTIRKWLEQKLGHDSAETMRILYGGSVNMENAKGIMSVPDVDGLLVGGSSLKAETFLPIIEIEGKS